MTYRILTLAIATEVDVVASRQRARQIAAQCGFGVQDQARIATSVSELARNVFNYAERGRIEFSIQGKTAPQVLEIRIEDQGPGIAQLDLILSGRYRSTTGMGLGLIGARRLMDRCEIKSVPGQGTEILLQKMLPSDAPLLTTLEIGAMGGQLAEMPTSVAMSAMQQQNQELLATLAELKARQDELLQLTRELEDTNRGVVALYAELDEKADHLRRADEVKSRFLSNMSHEFRTPLSSIRALSRLLLGRIDGELTDEQEKQVGFILKGAESLTELVDDLLDLAKIEAGKIDVRAAPFDVREMFSALRGMLRPLLVSGTVELVFEDPPAALPMMSDEAKISQILRNFISNALKFTEQGEVRVSVSPGDDGMAHFCVRDTGLGIAPEHQELIFEEFSQVENRLQKGVKGTGLGLPLCKRLAALLGGDVSVQSTPGQGSMFCADLPLEFIDRSGEHPASLATPGEPAAESGESNGQSVPLLVVEDDMNMMALYRRYLAGSRYRLVPARSLWEAEQMWSQQTPACVVLDIMLNGEESWRWLMRLKGDDERRRVPVVIASDTSDQTKGAALGAGAYLVKPVSREELLGTLDRLCEASLAAAERGST